MIQKIYKEILKSKKSFFIYLLVLTLISSMNLFHPGFTMSHDINFHLHRIVAVADNIRIHKFLPVYFNYLNGFGYGNGLFYPDTFLYIPAFLNYIGLSIEVSYKIFIIIINCLSLLSIYKCVHRITKEKKYGLISMIIYGCSLYRLIDLIERGALGETLTFIFIPLIILGIYEILYGEYKKSFYLTIGLSGLCLSHVISLYLMVFFIILLVIININCLKDKKRLEHLIINIIIPMMITSYFWVPMLEQLLSNKFAIMTGSKIFENIVPIKALFLDFPIMSLFDPWLPSGIGLIYYIGIIIYIKKYKNIKNRFIFSLFILGTISIIICIFEPIWKLKLFYKLFNVIQFPWRLYEFATVFLIIVFIYIIKQVKRKNIIRILITYTIVVFIANGLLYFINIYMNDLKSDEIMMGEYLPLNFDRQLIDNYENKNIEYNRNNNVLEVSVKKKKQEVEVPLIYYKGYKACNKEKCFKVSKSENGLVNVETNNEIVKFSVKYEGTVLQTVSKYISFFGLIFFITYKYNQR